MPGVAPQDHLTDAAISSVESSYRVTSGDVRIAAGTMNPAKLDAIRQAAAGFFRSVTVHSTRVDTGVPEQPWGDEEIAAGALARARAALDRLSADYGVGLESGLVDGPQGRIYVASWGAVVDQEGRAGLGGSERFALPIEIGSRLRAGGELGPLLDELYGQPGLARQRGAVSVFTQGRRSRTEILSVAVLHALSSLLEHWREPGTTHR